MGKCTQAVFPQSQAQAAAPWLGGWCACPHFPASEVCCALPVPESPQQGSGNENVGVETGSARAAPTQLWGVEEALGPQ